MDKFNTNLTKFAISLLGINEQYSYHKGSKVFKDVSSYQLKRFLDKNWDENEELEKFIKFQKIDWTNGDLIFDDTLLEKPYSKRIDGVYWQYSSKKNDFEKGINLTVMLWSNGKKCVPIAFMVYEKVNGEPVETKNDFALRALKYAQKLGITPRSVLFDSKYASKKLLHKINDFGWIYYTQLPRNRVFDCEQLSKQEFHLQVRAGKLKGVQEKVNVIKHCRKFFATNGKNVSRNQILRSYKPRWVIEDYFRALKQLCHLKECKSRTLKQQRRYIYVVMQSHQILLKMDTPTIYGAKIEFQHKFMSKKINGDKALKQLCA
jgi:hypothetical protein